MRPYRRTLASLLLSSLALLAPARGVTLEEALAAAQAAFNANDLGSAWQAAIEYAGLAAQGKQVEALGIKHYLFGELFLRRSEPALALGHYRLASWLAEDLKDNEGLAYCLMAEGICFRYLGRHSEALPLLERAADLYHAQENAADAGQSALLAGDSAQLTGQLEVSATRSQQAIDWLTPLGPGENLVQAHYLLARTLGQQGNLNDAFEQDQQGLTMAEGLGRNDLAAWGYNNLGTLAQTGAKLADAEILLRKALDMIDASATPDFAATVRANLASVLQGLGRAEEAERLYREAIGVPGLSDDSRATCLVGLSDLLMELGRLDEPMRLLDEATDLRVAASDVLGLATVRVQRGNLFSRLGDFRSALVEYFRAVELYEQIGFKAQLATAYNNIGRIYDSQGDLEHAVDYFGRSITLAQAAGSVTMTAISLNNMGLALFNHLKPSLPLDPDAPETPETAGIMDLLRQAEEAFDTAAKAMEGTGDQRYLATIINNQGQLAADMGKLDDAARYLEQALELQRQIGSRLGISQTAANLGLLDLRRGEYPQAAARLQEALKVGREAGDLEVESAVLGNLALLAEYQQDETTALDRYYECIDLIERRRSMIGGGNEQQQRFLASNILPYQRLIELLMRRREFAQAFAVAERAKGRALLDMMQSGRVELRDRLPADEAAQLTELEQAVAAAQVELRQVGEQAQATPEQLAAAREALSEARGRLETQESRLQALHPEAGAAEVQPLGFQAAAFALPPDTALLQFTAGVDEAYLFTVTNTAAGRAVEARQLEDDDRSLAGELAAFREACANPRRRYKAQAYQLYDRLLRPTLAALPEGITRLVIVPEGQLYDCPFQALMDSTTDTFLVDQYELVYGVSASVVAATLTLGNQRRQQPAGESMLVVADPEFAAPVPAEPGPPGAGAATKSAVGKVALEVGPDIARDIALVPLPGTRAEANAISALMPKVQELMGRAASETAVKAALPGQRILHFATHGLLDPEQPLYSAIAVAAPSAPGEDGFLEGREIARMSLNAELVCLSACQSGRGQALAGEGLIGLPWAFFVARVPTQIVSLWSVDDFMTMQLMKRFYAQLAAGTPKAEALRAAGRELRQAELTGPEGQPVSAQHPFYWAPFVLLGDWR